MSYDTFDGCLVLFVYSLVVMFALVVFLALFGFPACCFRLGLRATEFLCLWFWI